MTDRKRDPDAWGIAHTVGDWLCAENDHGDRVYVRDPGGALPPGAAAGLLRRQSSLPPDAVSVARSSADRELLVSAADLESAWIRTGAAVERWPRAIDEIGCA